MFFHKFDFRGTRNYVNKNQLDIALYANREQLIIKVAFVLASPCYLGHSKPFLIYFRTTRNFKYARSKSHQHPRLGASVVKFVRSVVSGTLTLCSWADGEDIIIIIIIITVIIIIIVIVIRL
jgi:hypothetical protein